VTEFPASPTIAPRLSDGCHSATPPPRRRLSLMVFGALDLLGRASHVPHRKAGGTAFRKVTVVLFPSFYLPCVFVPTCVTSRFS